MARALAARTDQPDRSEPRPRGHRSDPRLLRARRRGARVGRARPPRSGGPRVRVRPPGAGPGGRARPRGTRPGSLGDGVAPWPGHPSSGSTTRRSTRVGASALRPRRSAAPGVQHAFHSRAERHRRARGPVRSGLAASPEALGAPAVVGLRDQPPELGWNPSRSADSNRVASSRGQSMAARKCSAGLDLPSDPVNALETQCRSAGRTTARDEPFAAGLRRSGLRSCLGLGKRRCTVQQPCHVSQQFETRRTPARPADARGFPLHTARGFRTGRCQFASTSRAWQRSCTLGQRGTSLIESQGRIDVRTTPGFSGWGATHRRGRRRIHRRARGES
jgi:hypothetical protein